MNKENSNLLGSQRVDGMCKIIKILSLILTDNFFGLLLGMRGSAVSMKRWYLQNMMNPVVSIVFSF